MKAVSVVRIIACLAGLIAIGGSGAYAQSEIDPDHFESPNVEPFTKAKANGSRDAATIQYDGKFNLPYAVKCNGKSLRPGEYSISLHSDGKVGRAILNQKGQTIGIAGLIHNQGHARADHVLLIEHDGKTRRLSVIQVAELDFILDAEHIEHSSASTLRRIEKLPLVLVDGRK